MTASANATGKFTAELAAKRADQFMIRENLGDRFDRIGDEHLAFLYDGARPQADGQGFAAGDRIFLGMARMNTL